MELVASIRRCRADAWPVRLWAALSLLLAAAESTNAALLAWRNGGWARATFIGAPVLVAPDAGPALAGLLSPNMAQRGASS